MGYKYWVIFLITAGVSFSQLQNEPWNRHVIDAAFSGADGVRLSDVNGDNLLDITTGFEEGGYTKVFVNPGYSSSKELWPSVIAGRTQSVEDAVFADLNGDGAIDVISSTEGSTQKMYINWAPPDKNDYLDPDKWKKDSIPVSVGKMKWMYSIPIQVDGKNGIDIIAGGKDGGAEIGWFESPADPTNLEDWKYHTISSATWIMSLITRDMDGDGDLDVVTSDRKSGATQGVRWLENPGTGSTQNQPWTNHNMGAAGLEVMFMDLEDLDGDGLEDALVTEYSTNKIHFMKRLDSTGLNWRDYEIDLPPEAARPKSVKVGDINGDGVKDIVHSGNTLKDANKVGIIWLSVKDGFQNPEWNYHELSGPEGYKFDRLELVDLDGDGDLDVLTCEENYGPNSKGLGVIWYENPFDIVSIGKGQFHPIEKTGKKSFNVRGQAVEENNPAPFSIIIQK